MPKPGPEKPTRRDDRLPKFVRKIAKIRSEMFEALQTASEILANLCQNEPGWDFAIGNASKPLREVDRLQTIQEPYFSNFYVSNYCYE